MRNRTSWLHSSIVDAEPLRVVSMILALVHIAAILDWAWGPRGLLLACILQATVLALSAPWPPQRLAAASHVTSSADH